MRAGGEAVITRLADILVIQAIRHWVQHNATAQSGWLGALKDKRIGRAMAMIHRDPSRDWTVASLAQASSMSRSAFAQRFTALVGVPVVEYLTGWRMNLAQAWLSQGLSMAEVAARTGYQSDVAFARAFKRVQGFNPGSLRRAAGVAFVASENGSVQRHREASFTRPPVSPP
jgi:transcriptional regulator GlxA family with amidase domain